MAIGLENSLSIEPRKTHEQAIRLRGQRGRHRAVHKTGHKAWHRLLIGLGIKLKM